MPALLFFAVVESLAIAMDVIRLALWGPFILANVLQMPATLGTFYLVITIFGLVLKLISIIFAVLVRRDLISWEKDPHSSSTVGRNPLGWMEAVPHAMMGPQNGGRRASSPLAAPPVSARLEGDNASPPTEETRLLADAAPLSANSTPTKRAPSRNAYEYESFGNPM